MPHRTGKTAAAPAKTHCEALGLDPRCTVLEFKKAHQKIAPRWYHSGRLVVLGLDKNAKVTANALFVAENAAQETLLDEVARKRYDVALATNGLGFFRLARQHQAPGR
jgi:DnaJ-class molecular chaperone